MNPKTALIYSDQFLYHFKEVEHPESPIRLLAAYSHLLRTDLISKLMMVEPKMAELDIIKSIHSENYISSLRQACKTGRYPIAFADAKMSEKTFDVARLAVGGLVRSVELVMQGKVKNAFNLCRPPGHHAHSDRYCGFCYFNNVAIAAQYLLTKHRLKRVLILDFDVHGGNGTQKIFYNRNDVHFISIHGHPSFTFPSDSGFETETGENSGKGYNLNVCLPQHADDDIFISIFNDTVLPSIERYQPQFILLSAGFDAHLKDPIGKLDLTNRSFLHLITKVCEVAATLCCSRVVCTLEGGYNPTIVAELTTMFLTELISSGLST